MSSSSFLTSSLFKVYQIVKQHQNHVIIDTILHADAAAKAKASWF
jgi:hypothetical protein